MSHNWSKKNSPISLYKLTNLFSNYFSLLTVYLKLCHEKDYFNCSRAKWVVFVGV